MSRQLVVEMLEVGVVLDLVVDGGGVELAVGAVDLAVAGDDGTGTINTG